MRAVQRKLEDERWPETSSSVIEEWSYSKRDRDQRGKSWVAERLMEVDD